MRTIYTGKVTGFFPTRDDVATIAVGKPAPDCFGKLAKVVEITYRGPDIHGKLFACYYTDFGTGSRISNSVKEDEILRTVELTNAHLSREIAEIEAREVMAARVAQ